MYTHNSDYWYETHKLVILQHMRSKGRIVLFTKVFVVLPLFIIVP